jgi:hypothetical protein
MDPRDMPCSAGSRPLGRRRRLVGDYVLRNTGSGLRLVVSARMDPLPLHRYRLAGELTEIRASDLAFTVAEAALVPARHGCTLTADSLEYLTRQTEEGWAAGSRLAAVSMETHPDPDQFVTRLIADDNVLTGYPVAEVRRTAASPRRTAFGVTPDKLIDAVAHLATSTAVTTERSNPCAAGSRTRAHPSCSPMCSTRRPIR